MKCLECGEKLEKTKGNYQYKESGLNNIILVDIPIYRCVSCKETEVEIPGTKELHIFIAFMLLFKPTHLNGAEARFLRKSMGYTEEDLANSLGIKRVTVSRWENAKKGMKKDRDKHLRLFFMNKKSNEFLKAPGVMQIIKTLLSSLPIEGEKTDLKIHPDDWAALSTA